MRVLNNRRLVTSVSATAACKLISEVKTTDLATEPGDLLAAASSSSSLSSTSSAQSEPDPFRMGGSRTSGGCCYLGPASFAGRAEENQKDSSSFPEQEPGQLPAEQPIASIAGAAAEAVVVDIDGVSSKPGPAPGGRSRDRTRVSAVQRLVERRQAQKERDKARKRLQEDKDRVVILNPDDEEDDAPPFQRSASVAAVFSGASRGARPRGGASSVRILRESRSCERSEARFTKVYIAREDKAAPSDEVKDGGDDEDDQGSGKNEDSCPPKRRILDSGEPLVSTGIFRDIISNGKAGSDNRANGKAGADDKANGKAGPDNETSGHGRKVSYTTSKTFVVGEKLPEAKKTDEDARTRESLGSNAAAATAAAAAGRRSPKVGEEDLMSDFVLHGPWERTPRRSSSTRRTSGDQDDHHCNNISRNQPTGGGHYFNVKIDASSSSSSSVRRSSTGSSGPAAPTASDLGRGDPPGPRQQPRDDVAAPRQIPIRRYSHATFSPPNPDESSTSTSTTQHQQQSFSSRQCHQKTKWRKTSLNSAFGPPIPEGEDSPPVLDHYFHHFQSSSLSERLSNSQADQKKEEGNLLYKAKNYRDALSRYSEAIELSPQCPSFYGNRSACYMMLAQYREALDDARHSVQLDPSFVKGYIREAKCCLTMGDVVSAKQALSKAGEVEPLNGALAQERSALEQFEKLQADFLQAYNAKEYRKALFYVNRALSVAQASRQLKVARAECLAFLGHCAEAQEVANDMLRLDSIDADAMYVRGLCLYYEDNIDKAFVHFQQVLRLAPDHLKAKEVYKRAKLMKQKKEDGNSAFKKGDLGNAYTLYSEALQVDPQNKMTNAKLFFNRATVAAKLKKFKESIGDCSSALELDEKYLKAVLRRAKSYMDLEMYEEAVRDYEKAQKMDKSNGEVRGLLQQAKLELKKSKRKDYYKILGVAKDADDSEIKKAYRKRALVHHPDRHSSGTEEERKEHEKKFKEVGEAYNVLSDSKQRMRYDNGHDIDDLEGHGFGGGAEIDPNTIFQSFFGGGGPGGVPGGPGMQFSFGGAGGGVGGHPGAAGMHNGFSFQFC